MQGILADMREIVFAAAPGLRHYGESGPAEPDKLSKMFGGKSARDYFLWKELWASIKPVQFGNSVTWSDATELALARYQVPDDYSNVVLWVDCYTVNYTSAAIDLSLKAPPPPGTAWWRYESLGSTLAQNVTDPDMPVQIMTEGQQFLVFKGGYYEVLMLNLTSAPPDDEAREVRCSVYSYNIGAEILDRIGSNQAIAEITA